MAALFRQANDVISLLIATADAAFHAPVLARSGRPFGAAISRASRVCLRRTGTPERSRPLHAR